MQLIERNYVIGVNLIKIFY